MALVRERFKPRWYGFLTAWRGPMGVAQIGGDVRRAARTGTNRIDFPEPLIRLAQEEYDRRYPGQPYERMQERGGLSITEMLSLLADSIERQRWEASRTATTEEASPHG